MDHHATGADCSSERSGYCHHPADHRDVEALIDRRKLQLDPAAFAERARENRYRVGKRRDVAASSDGRQDEGSSEERPEGGYCKRSFLGASAALAASAVLAPIAFSTRAGAYDAQSPIFSTTPVSIREEPNFDGPLIKIAEEGTGMRVVDGPSGDSGNWWNVRVNGCDNSTGRQTGYCYETVTDRAEFTYGAWGTVSSIWGEDRPHGYHRGIDIANDLGTPIYAARQGVVTYADWAEGYGNVVYIDHGDGFETRYAHLSQIQAETDEWVVAGERIGDMGCTGTCTGPHLHFEIRVDGADQYWPQQRGVEQWLHAAIPRRWGLTPVSPTFPG